MPDYPLRMYHPNLDPPDNECEAMDARQAAVYAEAGWQPAPEPERKPGYEPEPVKYAPVEPEKPKAKTTKKAADN